MIKNVLETFQNLKVTKSYLSNDSCYENPSKYFKQYASLFCSLISHDEPIERVPHFSNNNIDNNEISSS